jgi:hypothetical protein
MVQYNFKKWVKLFPKVDQSIFKNGPIYFQTLDQIISKSESI